MYFRIRLYFSIFFICFINLSPSISLANDFQEKLKTCIHSVQDSSKSDNWLGEDKGRHLVGSLFLTTLAGMISKHSQDVSRENSQIIGCGVSLTFGLGKEIYDSTKINNRFSWNDLSADILGIIIGMVLLGIK